MPPKNIYDTSSTNTQPPVNQNPIPVASKTQTQGSIIPTLKKKLPKIFIFIGGGVLLLVLIIFVVTKFIGGSKSTTSGQITWWGLWEDSSVMTPLISSYEASHPGVKITYVMQSKQDYRERLASALAKGTGPDIFSFHNTWVPMFKNDLDALPATVMNPADFAKAFYPVVSSDLSYGNSIIGIPLGYDALTLYVNQDIFDKSGKTPPITWDELRTLARQLTVKDDQGIIIQSGMALGRTENVDNWQDILALLMIQNGVDLRNPTGKPAEDALTFFTLFSTIDGVWDATLPTSTQAFAAGKLAMYIAPSWRAFEIKQANPNLNFKTVAVPQLPKDSPSQSDITYATYWAQGVWSKSSNKSVSWDFLKYLSESDSLQKLYQNEATIRSFGEPYPRSDMAALLAGDPVIGSIIAQAPGARSWYLASRTFDGPTGINTQLSNYFADAVNSLVMGKENATDALATAAQGIAQVLKQYGISVR